MTTRFILGFIPARLSLSPPNVCMYELCRGKRLLLTLLCLDVTVSLSLHYSSSGYEVRGDALPICSGPRGGGGARAAGRGWVGSQGRGNHLLMGNTLLSIARIVSFYRSEESWPAARR